MIFGIVSFFFNFWGFESSKDWQGFQCGTFNIQTNRHFHDEKSSNLGDVELLETDESLFLLLHPGQCSTCSKSSCTSFFLVRCFLFFRLFWMPFVIDFCKKQMVRQGPGQLAPYMSLPQFWDLFWFHFLYIPLNNTVILRIFFVISSFFFLYISPGWHFLCCLYMGRPMSPISESDGWNVAKVAGYHLLTVSSPAWSWSSTCWCGLGLDCPSRLGWSTCPFLRFLSHFFWERNKWLWKLRYSGTHGRRMNLIFEKKPIMFFKAEHIE